MINEKFVTESHPQCYASTPISFVFSHYMIESQMRNEILLQVNIKNLLAAFRAVKENGDDDMTILKLTKKKNVALLSFEMWFDDGHEIRPNVIHDVPVKPVSHSKLYLYEEPSIGRYHASSLLPKTKSIKTVIERMRNRVEEKANIYIRSGDGQFLLEMKNEHCSIKTIYQNLGMEDKGLHQAGAGNDMQSVKACVDLKNLLKVIHALQPLYVQQTVIAITKYACVTIHAHLKDFIGNDTNEMSGSGNDLELARITFYICVYLNDEEEESENENETHEVENSQQQQQQQQHLMESDDGLLED